MNSRKWKEVKLGLITEMNRVSHLMIRVTNQVREECGQIVGNAAIGEKLAVYISDDRKITVRWNPENPELWFWHQSDEGDWCNLPWRKEDEHLYVSLEEATRVLSALRLMKEEDVREAAERLLGE